MSNENMSPYQYVNGQLAMTVTTAAGSTGPSGGAVTATITGPTGPGTEANAVRVTVASNSPVPLVAGTTGVAGGTGTAAANTLRIIPASQPTGTKSNVNDAAASTTILAANTSRRGFCIWNDSPSTLYLDLSGGTATATSAALPLVPGAILYEPNNPYTGLITGIWSADASGAARVTEFT